MFTLLVWLDFAGKLILITFLFGVPFVFGSCSVMTVSGELGTFFCRSIGAEKHCRQTGIYCRKPQYSVRRWIEVELLFIYTQSSKIPWHDVMGEKFAIMAAVCVTTHTMSAPPMATVSFEAESRREKEASEPQPLHTAVSLSMDSACEKSS